MVWYLYVDGVLELEGFWGAVMTRYEEISKERPKSKLTISEKKR